MSKQRSGGANVPRGNEDRASACSLATQAEVSSCVHLSPEELKALIPRALETPDLDLRPFLRLSPRQVAELMTLTDEWTMLCKAIVGLTALGRGENLTKSQRWAVGHFVRAASAPKVVKGRRAHELNDADVIDISPAGDE